MSLFATWQSLSMQNRIFSVGAVLATFLVFGLLLQTTTKPQMALLYSGLEPSAAGEVIAELEGLGVAYDVRGETIYTDASRRDMLRLELARQGLPRQNISGYELLDNLNSFAMTSEMFNTAYWRAKEGELSRTIMSLPAVTTARVHIGTAKQSSFSRTPKAQTASVTVTTTNRLDPQQARAVQYLAALAVSGLAPDDVAVIDTIHGVLAGPGATNEMLGGSADMDERSQRIEQALVSLLEARVGPGNARVSVSVEIDRNREVVSERIFDPETRVIKSRTASEVSEKSNGTGPANVTVASNLPEGEGAGGSSSSSDRSETTEDTQYEISEVSRQMEKLPGDVSRMTVAVLLNDMVITSTDGEVAAQPRTAEELADLQELVSAAAGINASRGDVLTIKSLAFSAVPEIEGPAAPGMAQQFVSTHLWSLIQVGVLAVVVIVLGLFVVKPLLTPQPAPAALAEAPALQLADGTVARVANNALADPNAQNAGALQSPAGGAAAGMIENAGAEEAFAGSIDPVDRLRDLTAEKPDDAAALLMSWLEEEGRVAS